MSDVVVFGTGLSGIACARALQAEDVSVPLIDTGRCIGGRMVTRRTVVAGKAITFDYGAQYLDQSEDTAATEAVG
tara:strand:- start:465 stop:689 length:225 start_codon:yes stop_codon:yes gene_type:complete